MWLLVGLLAGFFIIQHLAELPSFYHLWLCGIVAIVALWRPIFRPYGLCLLGISIAAMYTVYQAEGRLKDQLSAIHEGEVSRLLVRVNELATYHEDSIQFDAEVLESGAIKDGIPQYVRIYWSHSPVFSLYQVQKIDDLPEVRPGQVWEMSLQLNRPHSLLNPGGFDKESHLFRENIRALAAVKGNPILLEKQRHTLHTYIQAWRHDLRARLKPYWQDKRYGGVLIALVMGDQQGILPQDWALFNQSGITHLVSISGSHITMLSGLASLVSLGLLSFFSRGSLAEQYDIHAFAYGIGVAVALLYCLLAGWGIPAQRTFLMLLFAFLLYLFRLRVGLYQIFILTALIVLLLDPWALLSTGFYLSFAAVAVLHILLNRLRQYQSQRHERVIVKMLKEWVLVQGAITLALAPFLMYFFQQVSLISPLVNAYAVISVGIVITPLALLLALLSVLFDVNAVLHMLADFIHMLLYAVMELTRYLALLPWASVETSVLPLWVRLLCGIGIVWLLLPKGFPYRYWAIALCIPAFFFNDKPLREGEWRALFLDIGQGGAVLVISKSHVLLFDTGVRNSPYDESGGRVILPALRALGIKRIDTLVVSHADLDHSGGLASLVQALPIQQVYASFQIDAFLDREEKMLGKEIVSHHSELTYSACQVGKHWEVDNIQFRFLYGVTTELPIKSTNHQSCVLAIEGPYHRLLLTGDIFVEQEDVLRQSAQFLSPYHVIQVPHHGSLSSSGKAFVQDVQASYAIAQTAYQNRFKHPHPVVRQRWVESGVQFLNTAETGAVDVFSLAEGLRVQRQREQERRYWYHP